jgi:hypothetical protein
VCWKNDFRTPTAPPIRARSSPPLCEKPPDDTMVLRAMSPVKRGVPYIFQEFRDDIEVVSERLVDRIDPPRFVPLVGPVQLHHCHWKCSVYYVQTQESTYPFPYRCRQPRVEVVYIDKDHLHLYPSSTDSPAELGNQDSWRGYDSGGVERAVQQFWQDCSAGLMMAWRPFARIDWAACFKTLGSPLNTACFQADRIDWAAYFRAHGYQLNGGCSGCGCGQIHYAPVTTPPNMQWGMGNAVPAPAPAKPR